MTSRKPKGDKVQVTFGLALDDFDAFVTEAERRGMSQSGFARFCVKAVLARNIVEIPAEAEHAA